MKPVLIHPAAKLEFAESVDYYEQLQPGLGLEYEAVARHAVAHISDFPERHMLRRDGTRRVVIRRFPFVIHYLDMPEYVWIIVFAHTSRKPGYWRKRLPGDGPN